MKFKIFQILRPSYIEKPNCTYKSWNIRTTFFVVHVFILVIIELFHIHLEIIVCSLWKFLQGGILWFQNLSELPHGTLGHILPLLIAGLHFMNVQVYIVIEPQLWTYIDQATIFSSHDLSFSKLKDFIAHGSFSMQMLFLLLSQVTFCFSKEHVHFWHVQTGSIVDLHKNLHIFVIFVPAKT